MRSAWRPRLRSALLASFGAAVIVVLLGAADATLLALASPNLGRVPGICAKVTLSKTATGVVVTGPAGQFTIDADETLPTSAGAPGVLGECALRGARLCTSDEWALACLCTYPNESEGGSKLGVNDRLLYRTDVERVDPATESGLTGLLTGRAEVVGPTLRGGVVLTAGPNDGVADPWTVDCRYRGIATRAALLASSPPFIGVRCCR